MNTQTKRLVLPSVSAPSVSAASALLLQHKSDLGLPPLLSMALIANEANGCPDGATFVDGQLSFIGQDCTSIPDELVKNYANVTTRLDLSFNCISNLNSLEAFKNLTELVLDSNAVDDDTVFPPLPLLQTLSLNKNKIVNLYSFLAKVRLSYPGLCYLSLLGNAACRHQLSSQDNDDQDYQRYRYYVIYILPSLKFLDASTVTAAEQDQAKLVGPSMPTVQQPQVEDKDSIFTHSNSSNSSVAYTPLPEESSTDYRHITVLSKKTYRYNGKHSEGNRFIRNDDL